MSTTSLVPFTPVPYGDLHIALSQLMRARAHGEADYRILETGLRRFLDCGWEELNSDVRLAIDALPEEDRRFALQSLDDLRQTIKAIWPRSADDYARHSAFARRIFELAALVGERMIGMRMAGAWENQILATTTAATELLLNAHAAGRIEQLALLYQASIDDIAPAIFAALLAHSHENAFELDRALRSLLPKSPTQSLSSEELESVAHLFSQALRQADTRISQVLAIYESSSRGVFLSTIAEPETRSAAIRDEVLGALPNTPPQIRVSTLVAFAASARGGDQTSRIEGATELLRSIIAMARIRYRDDGLTPSRHALLGTAIAGLRRLDPIVRNERYAHHVIEKRWRLIEREMRYLQQRNPKSKVILPLPEDIEAPECMALYIQDLVSRGVPLGIVLSEIGDSSYLTFGPSEFRLFCRVATYAARKYAANLATHESPILRKLAEKSMRGQQIVQTLADIEYQARREELRTDPELAAWIRSEIQERVRAGVLRPSDAEIGMGLVDEMITRIRAGQEVRYLTALLALEGTIPSDVLRAYSGLPHTRRFALLDAAETRFYNLHARNGQSFRELRQDVYARWMRYRQQAPLSRDVVPIRLRYEEDFDRTNAMPLRGGRRLFRKEFGDFLPDPDLDEIGDRAIDPSPTTDNEFVKPSKERNVQYVGHRRH